MAKTLKINLKVNAETGKVTQVSDAFNDMDKRVKKATNSASEFRNKVKTIAKTVAGLYVIKQAFNGIKSSIEGVIDTSSQSETYTNRMTAFTQGQAQANAEIDRGVAFALKYKTSINDTMDALLLMKNYGLDDSNESLKIFTNTAIGSGKSLSQYAEAVADALTGENERLKEFGIKASKIGEQIGYVWTDSAGKTRNVIIENNKEIINSTLNTIMNEKYVGQIEKRASSWAGLMQNMSNNFTVFQKNIGDNGLFDYFKQLGDGISKIFADSFDSGGVSAKQFADDTISFMNSIIKAVGFVAKALAGVANLARVVYGGIQKLAGTFVGGAADERLKNKRADLAELQNMVDTGEYGIFSDRNYGVVRRKIIAIKKEIASTVATQTWAKDVRASGDATVEAAAKSQANINALLDKVTALGNVNRTTIKATTTDIDKQKEAATKALNSLNAGYGQLTGSTSKAAKGLKAKTKALRSNTASLREAKRTADEYARGLESAIEKFLNSTLSKEDNAFRKLGDDIKEMSKYLSNGQLSKYYEAEMKKMQKQSKNLGDILQDVLGIKNDSLFANLFDGLLDGFKSIVGALSSSDPFALSNAAGAVAMSSLNLIVPGLGEAVAIFGSLLSSEVSQAEIDSVKGRTEFSDESLSKLANTLNSVETPLLPYTKRMTDSMNAVKNNTYTLTKAFKVSSGLEVSGAGFKPTAKGNIWGGKSTSLIDSKLRLGNVDFDGGIDTKVLTEILVKKSSWFGLVKSSRIKTIIKDAGDNIDTYMNDIMSSGKDFIISASASLGYDVEQRLNQYRAQVADISLKGLSSTEQEERINKAFSEIFSGAIGSLEGISNLVEAYAESGEENLATLGRIATEYEQGAFLFSNTLSRSFTDIRTVYEKGAYDLKGILRQTSSDISDFFGTIGADVETFYTAQEQILDITKFSGGSEALNSNIRAFANNFLTDQEQYDAQLKVLTSSFSTIGITLPDLSGTLDENNQHFKDLIQNYQIIDEASSRQYAQLLGLSEQYSALTQAQKALKDEEKSRLNQLTEDIRKATAGWIDSISYLDDAQKDRLYDTVSDTRQPAKYSIPVNNTPSISAKITDRDKEQDKINKKLLGVLERIEKTIDSGKNDTRISEALTDIKDQLEASQNKVSFEERRNTRAKITQERIA